MNNYIGIKEIYFCKICGYEDSKEGIEDHLNHLKFIEKYPFTDKIHLVMGTEIKIKNQYENTYSKTIIQDSFYEEPYHNIVYRIEPFIITKDHYGDKYLGSVLSEYEILTEEKIKDEGLIFNQKSFGNW